MHTITHPTTTGVEPRFAAAHEPAVGPVVVRPVTDGTGVAASYTIWRRVMGTDDAYTQVATPTNLTFDDLAVGNWEYEVTFTLLP